MPYTLECISNCSCQSCQWKSIKYANKPVKFILSEIGSKKCFPIAEFASIGKTTQIGGLI